MGEQPRLQRGRATAWRVGTSGDADQLVGGGREEGEQERFGREERSHMSGTYIGDLASPSEDTEI